MPRIGFLATVVVVWCRHTNSPHNTQAMCVCEYRVLGELLFSGDSAIVAFVLFRGDPTTEPPVGELPSLGLFLSQIMLSKLRPLLPTTRGDPVLELLMLYLLLLLPATEDDFGEFTSFGICDTKHADWWWVWVFALTGAGDDGLISAVAMPICCFTEST